MSKRVLLLKNSSVPSDPYEERLTSLGYQPTFIPLLTHTHFDKSETIQYLESAEFINDVDVIIITSQRGVEMLDECLQSVDGGIQAKICQKIAYTVGPATYGILQRMGFSNVRGGNQAGNGLKLAYLINEELTSQQYNSERKMIFFTGEIRKDILPKTLKGMNYNLVEKVIYKTAHRDDIVANFNQKWVGGSGSDSDWIVFFSPQGTESIVRHIQLDSRVYRIASIGPTTEEYLLQNGIRPDVVSAKPDAVSLVSSIEDFCC